MPTPLHFAGLRVAQFALAVSDLPTMTRWYGEALGFELVGRGRFDAVGADYALVSGAGVTLELITLGHPEPVPVDRAAPPHHLARLGWKALVLYSDALTALTRHLESCGADMVWCEAEITPGVCSTMVRDPEGNLIHVIAAPASA